MQANLYHAHHKIYKDDISYWKKLAQEAQGRVLELGCGTGRVMLPLVQEGFPVLGLDNDLASLVFAQSQFMLQGIEQPSLMLADMISFSIAEVFPLIMVPCNTFSTLTVSQQKQTIRNCKRHLSPEGKFVFSIPNPIILMELAEESDPELENIFIHPETGFPVQVSSAWKKTTDKIEMLWFYDHLLPDGRIDRHTTSTTHFFIPPEGYQLIMDMEGFETILYGGFSSEPFETDLPYLIVEGQKR